MRAEIIARPLSHFPGAATADSARRPGRFIQAGRPNGDGTYRFARVTPIGQTVDELAVELGRLGVPRAVLELDITERDCRRDGNIRADAKPTSPRVVLSFEHPEQGATRIPADRFDAWHDNVRAIRLALEALRAVDRYGITRHAEQYRGWQALPPAGGSSAGLNASAAARLLVALDPKSADLDTLGASHAAARLLGDVALAKAALRRAAVATHPDRDGGSTDRFQTLQQARGVLAAHFNERTL